MNLAICFSGTIWFYCENGKIIGGMRMGWAEFKSVRNDYNDTIKGMEII